MNLSLSVWEIGYLIYVPMTVGYLMVGFFTVKIILDLGELSSIKRIAFHDPLTGAYNRAFIEEYVEEELRKARRLNEEFCIMLADLNDFKRVNDRYGHDAGDSVLKRVVRELKRHLRDYDLVARWGGDEFLIVLPSEKEADVLEVVGRLVSDFVVNYEDTEVTLSVGYACFPRDGMSLRELVRKADHRMYRSKSLFKEAKRHAVDDKGSEEV